MIAKALNKISINKILKKEYNAVFSNNCYFNQIIILQSIKLPLTIILYKMNET